MKNKEKKIYVFSTGRVGSTYISKTLSSMIQDEMVVHQQKNARLINILGHMRLTGRLPHNLFSRFSNYFYKSKLPLSSSDPLIAVFISFYLNNFDENDYKILHLVRDPRDFVTSFMNWKNRKISGLVAHHLTPFWQPDPFFAGEINILKWIKMSKFEHYCWIWNFKNLYFINTFSEKKNYKLIRLEDLISEDYENHWHAIFDFLDIPRPQTIEKRVVSERVNKSNQVYFEKWQNWDTSMAKILDKQCGQLMQKLEYGAEKEWMKKMEN